MKSFLFTVLLSMGVGHTGAFLEVWEIPYVEDHFTLEDLTRKVNKVTKWKEMTDSLRVRRDKAAEENYALLPSRSETTRPEIKTAPPSRGARYTREKMTTSSLRTR